MKNSTTSFDKRTVTIDLLKYIGTLSFGAIILISGHFLRSLTEFPNHKAILIVIVCAFFSCIVFSAMTYAIVARNINLHVVDWAKHNLRIANCGIGLSLFSFFGGAVSLMYFVLVNIV